MNMDEEWEKILKGFEENGLVFTHPEIVKMEQSFKLGWELSELNMKMEEKIKYFKKRGYIK